MQHILANALNDGIECAKFCHLGDSFIVKEVLEGDESSKCFVSGTFDLPYPGKLLIEF